MKRITIPLTLLPGRDKAGHMVRTALAVLLIYVCPAVAGAQGPGAYKAQRFDVVVTPRAGNLEVLETIRFEFQSGTFRKVWRDLPTSHTDGIDIVEARIDGVVWPRGKGDGRVEVSGRGRVRVQWNFAPMGPSVHVFELRYVARGVVYREDEWDVLRWRALPSEHRYAIDASRIVFATGEGTPGPAETRQVGSVTLAVTPPGMVIDASSIRSNGWIIGQVRYPAGRMIAAPPEWQQRRLHADRLAPRWQTAAAALFAVGIGLLLGVRQSYPTPSISSEATTTTSPPAPLPAALASVIAAKGRTIGYQAIGTLLDLADRGVIVVRELPRLLGVRQYEISRVPGTHDLANHEEETLRMAFAGRQEPVALSKARGRLARGARRFAAAVNADLDARGFLDRGRKSARDRMTVAAIALLLVGAAGNIVAAALIPRYEAWPFLLPLAVMVAGIVGIIMASAMTPLSDMGLIEAARWRGFKRHLRSMADTKAERAVDVAPRWIVYAIALGLANQWSRYLRAHPGAAPAWFVPAARDDSAAFASFIGSHAATSGGGASAAGGGAAGGGGSGAG